MTYSRIASFMEMNDRINGGYIAVIVGTVLDDTRDMEPPKGLKVCALKCSASARKRIESRGGKVYTFEDLAKIAPTGGKLVLLRGGRRTEKKKHFGAPGERFSKAKPKMNSTNGGVRSR